MKQYFAGLSRNTFLLAAASFFADTSTEMLYPVLPVFLTLRRAFRPVAKKERHSAGWLLPGGNSQASDGHFDGMAGRLRCTVSIQSPTAFTGGRLGSLQRSFRSAAISSASVAEVAMALANCSSAERNSASYASSALNCSMSWRIRRLFTSSSICTGTLAKRRIYDRREAR
jgi:hypothetical protein